MAEVHVNERIERALRREIERVLKCRVGLTTASNRDHTGKSFAGGGKLAGRESGVEPPHSKVSWRPRVGATVECRCLLPPREPWSHGITLSPDSKTENSRLVFSPRSCHHIRHSEGDYAKSGNRCRPVSERKMHAADGFSNKTAGREGLIYEQIAPGSVRADNPMRSGDGSTSQTAGAR
jgi:hypothetical protein